MSVVSDFELVNIAPSATSCREWTSGGPSDIALINVPYGAEGQVMRPLGLASLGAHLVANGISAQGFDFSFSSKSPRELVSEFNLSSYNVLGLSIYNVNAVTAFEFARELRRTNPRCIIMAGGPHVSAVGPKLLRLHPEFDIIIQDEAELSLLTAMQHLKLGEALTNVPGLSFRHIDSVVQGPPAQRIENLDELTPPIFRFTSDGPLPEHLFYDRDSQQIKAALPLVTSRSCPYNCSFCAIILIGRRWRKLSTNSILQHLQEMERANGETYTHIYFLDANFFVDARRTLSIAKELHDFRPGLTFSFSTRVNQLVRAEALLPELRRYGLRAVELGVESGSQEVLKRFSKDTSVEQNDRAIELLKKNSLELYLDFIMFDAECSLEELRCNLDFLERNSLDFYVPWDHLISAMTPYLGTQIRDRYQQMMGTTFDEDALPDPETLFSDQRVRAVYIEMSKIIRYLPKLKAALQSLEGKVNGDWTPDVARHALNAMTVRRLPFVVLGRLIAAAREGKVVSFSEALPTFFGDHSEPYSLEEFIRYALQ